MSNETFYAVHFETDYDDVCYFKNHEQACAFLLESYFDDFEVTDEAEVIEINNTVADTDKIANYAYIVECWFED